MPGGISEFDVQMMRRAIRLAMNGRGAVEPNPMVGCVLAKGERVIGEGCHAKYGGPHAEPTALANATEPTEGATAYVTLEPCCHTDKKTPPCVPALIKAKIARVVVGCVDPNPDVNGKGLDQLRAAGIRVDANVLEDQAKQLLAPFIARVVYGRPYVTLKWAETADGKVAGHEGARLQISNPQSTRIVHELRARSDVIVVGINTVLSDDPLLTARDVANPRPLHRVVLDRQLRLPLESRLVQTAKDSPVTVFCSADAWSWNRTKANELEARGAKVSLLNRVTLSNALGEFGNATHALVEAGPKLAAACFAEDIVDRVWLIHSPMVLNDPSAPAAASVPGDFVSAGEFPVGDDRLVEYLNQASPAFFAVSPSADFVLARERSGA